MASWYGPYFAGRHTANGERFNPNANTAAHRKYPFDTVLLVKNLENGKHVVVRVTDRGPYKSKFRQNLKPRDIDLSRHAARVLGMEKQGVAPVSIKVLHWGHAEDQRKPTRVVQNNHRQHLIRMSER